MLVEYNNDVFNAEIEGDKVNIWKYVPVNGFEKVQTQRGIVYYEGHVSKEEISEPFSVSFFAETDDRKYIINTIADKKMTIMCDDQEFAIATGFKETEHGIWVKTVDIESFEVFSMIRYVQNSSDRMLQRLNSTELLDCWKRYVKDVSI